MKTRRTLLYVLALLLIAATAPARASEYLDRLFAPPTAEELNATRARRHYEPHCEAFILGAVYLEAPGYVLHKITYRSDGLTQTGLFGAPKKDGLAPLAMINHAGFSGFGKMDDRRLVQYLERGYAVAVATYRGEAGEAGLAEGAMDVLGDEAHDILNLMECAAGQPGVDPDRIVMMGVSHGAGLTLSALAETRRVTAAAVAAAPSNLSNTHFKELAAKWLKQPGMVEAMLQALMPKKGIAIMKKLLVLKNPDPERLAAARLEIFRRSPALFPDDITVPMLFFYGGQDPVAIAADGRVIVDSLRRRGIFADITVYEERGHGLTYDESESVHAAIIDFFDARLVKN